MEFLVNQSQGYMHNYKAKQNYVKIMFKIEK